MRELVIATHNEGKRREIETLLAPLGFTVLGAGALSLPEPEENGVTFTENAAIKALAAAQASGRLSLSDDSGLAVSALGDAPGIYSARWAGPQKDFSLAFARIQKELSEISAPLQSPAYFICMLCLAEPSGETHFFEGRVDGTLTFPPRGEKGFGYDPIFIPEGDTRTFAEMPESEKHAISHRARAFAKLVAWLEKAEAA